MTASEAAPDDHASVLRAWAAHADAADPGRRRFGAGHHGYRWAPTVTAPRLAAIEAELGVALPASYRRFVTTVGDGGVGPYYGLMPLDHPVQLAAAAGEFRAPAIAGPTLHRGVLGLGHVGCGQLAVLIVRSADPGAGAGEVWIDARASGGGVLPIAPDFDVYVLGWITALAHHQFPRGFVAPGTCALPRALSEYLAAIEARAGVAPGALSPDSLRAAFAALPVDAIRCEASGDDPFFPIGATLDPCCTCEGLLANLAGHGLARDRVMRGENPLPTRPFSPLASDIKLL